MGVMGGYAQLLVYLTYITACNIALTLKCTQSQNCLEGEQVCAFY